MIASEDGGDTIKQNSLPGPRPRTTPGASSNTSRPPLLLGVGVPAGRGQMSQREIQKDETEERAKKDQIGAKDKMYGSQHKHGVSV